MTDNDKTVGVFLNRLLDLLEEGVLRQNQETKGLERQKWDKSNQEESNQPQEKVYICRAEDCTFIEEKEEKMIDHIEQEHDRAAYREMRAQKLRMGDGGESFQAESDKKRLENTKRSIPEIDKEERKKMVRDWFNQHCESASTIPEVAKGAFGTDKELRSGDREYTMVFSILDELREEGFLDIVKDGSWNRYFSERNQLEVKR